MSTKRLWLIAGSAVAAVVALVLLAGFLVPQSSEAEPSPTPTMTASAAPSPSATPAASATPSPTATTVVATCETTSTDAFRAMMAANGWVSWETQGQLVGPRPFDGFPNGSPRGALVCRWGADPGLAPDDIIDLAWAPIDPENAVAAMQQLEASGYTRIDAPEGVYLALKDPAGIPVDAEGYADTYLFTQRDVRWAVFKAYTASIKSPTEGG
ncbi:hypothetical protein SAMN04487846_2242 [Microbacterium sp. cf046]|uniref:hypothetical protein n=1 Tax=Microbacterium sp. cf046 TaxID=1761803 RepID=UPI0008EA90D8|nr:hypothetical protein [Microbacterium sp. cf046]SFS07472.1 hypothetical protein SAMN04487846_2242 [Microbacterium sp. cf046]